MTFSEIKMLLDAGFNKDEIMALDQTGEVTRIVPDPVPDPAPAEDPLPDHVNGDDPVPDPAPAEDPVSDPAPAKAAAPDPITKQLNDNITKLIKTIQASNLSKNSMDGMPDLNKQVDTIMESIIRPIKEVNDK